MDNLSDVDCTEIFNRYKNIVNTIGEVFKSDFNKLIYTNEIIKDRVNLFYKSLEDDNLFLLFTNNKIKVFSSKSNDTDQLSKSLFGEDVLLKNLFNNQNNGNKLLLWDCLMYLYIYLEKVNKNREERMESLRDRFSLNKSKMSDCVKDNILPDNVNDTTTNMVNDIIGSFEDIFSGNKNPFENIMEVTTKISEKYYKDIENGNVEIDKLINNMPIPGKSNGDSNEIGDMMKGMGGMMDNLMKGNGDSNEMGDMMKGMGGMMENMLGGNMGDMMKNVFNKKEEEPTVIDENFSTANVEVGENKEKNGNMVGSMLNMANKLPDLGNLTSMVSDLQNLNTNDKDGLSNIKNQMDGFLEKSLGVDIDKFNQSMENLVENLDNKKRSDNTVEDNN